MALTPRETKLVAGAAVAGGIAAVVLYRLLGPKSAAGGASKQQPEESKKIYETKASVNQYLEFHFVEPELSYGKAKEAGIDLSPAFGFPARLARYVEKHARPDRRRTALDVGCAVGRTTFELSRTFDRAVGVDLSTAFIEAAEEIRTKGKLAFDGPGQGHIFMPRVAKIPPGVQPNKSTFLVRDAVTERLLDGVETYDAVVAANLICRVPDPRTMLRRFKELVTPGGVLVLASPYSWWAGATDPSSWFGGTPEAGASEPAVKAFLTGLGFELLEEGVAPFLIRDHERRYQSGYSHLTIWRRKE